MPTESHTSKSYRLNPADIKSQAQGHWHRLLNNVGVDEQYLRNKHGPCPVCGGKDRFRFDNKRGSGSFFCNNCGAGDGLRLVKLLTGKSAYEALKLVALLLSSSSLSVTASTATRRSHKEPQFDERKMQAIRKVLADAQTVQRGDPVWRYLNDRRKLHLSVIPEALLYHEGLEYWLPAESGGWHLLGIFPAMVASILSPTGALVGCHRTFLTADGDKASVPKAKKLMASPRPGITNGGAIHLYQPSHIVGVAEGIETALACHQATGLPVWSTLSDGGMARLQLPSSVSELVIFADRDESNAGQEAARKLACRMYTAGKRVKWLQPTQVGIDFADVFEGFGYEYADS